jgi:hypothetical protein
MVNAKLNFVKRLSLFLGGILLFGNLALGQTVVIKTVVDNYVQGVHQYATVKLYANTGNANIGISNLVTQLTLKDPVILDKNNHTSVLGVGDNWLNKYTDACKTFNTFINAGLTSPMLEYSIPGSPNDILIATMTFKISLTPLASFELDIKCTSLQLFNITAGGYTGTAHSYRFENQQNAGTPSTVTIPILEGFNFGTIAGKVVTIDEDAYSATPFELAATDPEYFASTEWNEAQEALVAVVPPQAQFTGISLVEPDGTRNDYVTEINDPEKGQLKIVNGVIQYTQAENYFNEEGFTVWYKVASTSNTTTDAVAADSILFKVTPVNDPPVVVILAIGSDDGDGNTSLGEAYENRFLTVLIKVTDVENDLFDITSITLGGEAIAGNWESDAGGDRGSRANQNLAPGKYLFTSTDRLPYTMVTHPDTAKNLMVEVQIKDQGAPEPETAAGTTEATIYDVDRKQTDPANAVITPADPITTDALKAAFTASVDADGDRITYTIKWYKEVAGAEPELVFTEVTNDLQATLSADKIKKHDKFEARVYSSTQPYGDNGDSVDSDIIVSNTVTVLNSAPVSAMTDKECSVFVQKSDVPGHEAKSTVTLKVKDLDGLKEETLVAWISTAAGKGTIGDIGADELNATQLTLPAASSQGTLAFTYTVNNPGDDESYNYDTFTITVKDSDGETVDIAFTVDYITNPPPTFTWTLLSSYNPETEHVGITFAEVDADGAATVFYVKVEARDADVVKPAGISNITLEAPGLGAVERVFWDKGQPIPATRAEAGTAVAVFSVATKGYDTIVNAGDPPARAKNKDFPLTITVTDVFNDNITNTAPDNGELKVTITDDDQKPTAPTQMTLTPAADIVANTALNILAAGGTDADGDRIEYAYKWFYLQGGAGDPILAGEGADLPAASDALKKGNVIYAEAKSVTNPYNDANDLRSSGVTKSAELTVGNSAPAVVNNDVVTFGDAGLAYDDGGEEGDVTTATLPDIEDYVTDIDVEDGVDKLAFTIVKDSLVFDLNPGELTAAELEACLAIDSTPKEYGDEVSITFAPAGAVADFYGKFTFTIKATDESGSSVTRQVSFEIKPVNDQPSFLVKDIYVMPDELGQKVEAWFQVNMGGQKGYEDSQSIAGCQVELVDNNQAALFAVLPAVIAVDADDSVAVGVKNQWLYLSFTLNNDVPLGEQIAITLQATDNGQFLDFDGNPQFAAGETSDDMTLKIVVGATPWYPICEIVCVDPANHNHAKVLVEILNDAGAPAGKAIILNKNEDGDFVLMPKDYYRNGYAGFLPGTAYDLRVYDYDLSGGGKGALCFATDDQPLEVPDYGVPGAPDRVTWAPPADASRLYTFNVNTPVASSFVLEIVQGAEGEEVPYKTITQKYEPDADGVIIPATAVKVELPDGRYLATVYGLNPLYPRADGNQVYPNPKWSEPLVVDLDAPEGGNANWDTDKGFNPPNGTINYIEAGVLSDITFSWPVAGNAESYNLTVYRGDGTSLANVSTADNSATVTGIPEGNYTWVVTAIAGGRAIDASPYLSLRFQAPSATPVISEISVGAAADQLVLEMPTGPAAGQLYEMIYYDADHRLYQFFAEAAVAVGAGNVITFPGVVFTPGSWVLLRPVVTPPVAFEVYVISQANPAVVGPGGGGGAGGPGGGAGGGPGAPAAR